MPARHIEALTGEARARRGLIAGSGNAGREKFKRMVKPLFPFVGKQEQCVDEAVNRLGRAQDELERARFNHKRARPAHLKLGQEAAAISSRPRVMDKELRKRADKVAQTLRGCHGLRAARNGTSESGR